MKTFFIITAFLTLPAWTLKAQNIVPIGLSPVAGTVKTDGKNFSFRISDSGNFTAQKAKSKQKEEKIIKLSAYPNPFTEKIKISFPFELSETPVIQFADMTGRVFNSEDVYRDTDGFYVSVPNLSPGHYVIRVLSGKNVYTLKVVKL
ncbi:MAG: T9SS type A sorting domain-containing protein [Bacteroidales bacterium]|nr:T9SS type A sorting domain-containing protein [Bacteroidales bacterium]MBR4677534.1 T9SS type A sorting domain-containing protein [Bacteroidales bacterium]